jgi:hypothetical protein
VHEQRDRRIDDAIKPCPHAQNTVWASGGGRADGWLGSEELREIDGGETAAGLRPAWSILL